MRKNTPEGSAFRQEAQLFHPPVKRRPADAEQARSGADIAICPRESPAQFPPLGAFQPHAPPLLVAQNIHRRTGRDQRRIVQPIMQPGAPSCADDQIIAVNRKQYRALLAFCRALNNPGLAEGAAEILRLDPHGRLFHRLGNQRHKGRIEIPPAGGDIQHRCQLARLPKDRRAQTDHRGIAGMVVLIPQHMHWPAFGNGRADSVGALTLLRPVRPPCQAGRLEILLVSRAQPLIQHDPISVTQDHATPGQSQAGMQLIHHSLRHMKQPANRLAMKADLRLAETARPAGRIRLQPVFVKGADPGRRHR